MASERRSPLVLVLFVSAVLATVIIHVRFLPRFFPHDLFWSALTLQAGWITFAIACYSLGRLFSNPGPIPSMRTGDVGTALFLVSLLLSLFLDTMGFSVRLVTEVHLVLGIGVYAGLALIGWAIGQRTKAINRIARGE